MTTDELEQRLVSLEGEVSRLRNSLDQLKPQDRPWWERIVGVFADDPAFEEAMTLGRDYRNSLPPAEDEPNDDSEVHP